MGKKIDITPNDIVTSNEVMKIISKLLEVSLYPFVTKSLIVKNIADIIGKIKTKPNFKLTGLITINTPINPMITADHLLMPTFSLRKIAPAAVINMGIVLRRVYTSDIGINMRPVKNVNAAKISKRPLEYDLLS